MADYATDIEFKCPECGETVEVLVQVSPPNWTEDKAIDRVVQEDVIVECPECGEAFETEVTNCDNQVEMIFVEHRQMRIRCGMGHDRAPDFDDWDLPASPADELRFSMQDTVDLLRDHGSQYGPSTVNRMAFISCFAAFEAYLGDTLLKYVFSDDDALKRILKEELELKSKKVDLLTILTDDKVVTNSVTDHLKSMMWHNLAKADAIYLIAARFSIFNDPAVKKQLFKAIPVRHDCVHRNGNDRDGNPRRELTRQYVEAVANAILATADHIEDSIAAQTV
ncbi:MAG: hypothetical protein ACTHJU_03990 [Sphingopyxis sp.]